MIVTALRIMMGGAVREIIFGSSGEPEKDCRIDAAVLRDDNFGARRRSAYLS